MFYKSLWLIVALALTLIVSGTIAQENPRPVITAENAAQVELLAQMGVERVDGLGASADGEMGEARRVASPDGSLVAEAGNDGRVQVWSMPDETLVNTLDAHFNAVWDIAFSLDGATLATAGGDGAIHLWDVATWEKRRTISGLGMAITSIDYSPDGSRLAAGGWDGSLWIFDAADGQVVESRPTQQFLAWTITFNADGTRFALGNDGGEVVLFDVVDEPPFIVQNRVFRAHQGPLYALAFHPDGRHLVSGGIDGMIYVWDMDSGEIVQQSEIEQNAEFEPLGAIHALAYSPDGTDLHCGTLGGRGIAQDITDAKVIRCYRWWADDGSSPIYSLAYSPDGSHFAYTRDGVDSFHGTTVIENLERQTSVMLETRRAGMESYVSTKRKLTFSADGRVLLNSGLYQPTHVWHMDDLASGLIIDTPGLLALNPDGSLIAGGNLSFFDTTTGEEIPVREAPTVHYADLTLHDAVFSPDGSLVVTASASGVLRFWGVPLD